MNVTHYYPDKSYRCAVVSIVSLVLCSRLNRVWTYNEYRWQTASTNCTTHRPQVPLSRTTYHTDDFSCINNWNTTLPFCYSTSSYLLSYRMYSRMYANFGPLSRRWTLMIDVEIVPVSSRWPFWLGSYAPLIWIVNVLSVFPHLLYHPPSLWIDRFQCH